MLGVPTCPSWAAAFCDIMIDKKCLFLLALFPTVCPCALPLAAFSLSHAVVNLLGKVSQKHYNKTKPDYGGPYNTVTFAVVPIGFDRLQEV